MVLCGMGYAKNVYRGCVYHRKGSGYPGMGYSRIDGKSYSCCVSEFATIGGIATADKDETNNWNLPLLVGREN